MSTTGISQSPFISFLEPVMHGMPLWFQEGGILMLPLLLTSFLITVIASERLYFWCVYYNQKERFFLQECFAALYKQQKTDALLACQQLETPALIMLRDGISILPLSPKEKMISDAKKQISLLSRGQSFLYSAVIVSPILGILGMLINLISSFTAISLQDSGNPNLLIAIIGQSFIPVAASLIILLFALIPYQFFRTQIYKVTLHLETVRSQFENLCQQKRLVRDAPESSLTSDKQENIPPLNEEKEEILNKSVSEQTNMPYHYEFSDETGEVNVSIHEQTEDIKRVSTSSIAEMYDKQLLNADSTEKESMSEDEYTDVNVSTNKNVSTSIVK